MGAKRQSRKRGPYLPLFEGLGKREYQQRFAWLLSLLNADIEKIDLNAFLSIFYKYLDYLFGMSLAKNEKEGTLRRICRDTDLNRQRIRETQVLARKELERLICDFKKILPGSTLISLEDEMAFSYNMAFEGRVIALPNARILPKDYVPCADTKKLDNDAKHHETVLNFSDFAATYIHTAVKFFLYSLFERIPLYSIFRCEHCNNYVKKTVRKETDLCRPCLGKQNTYKWRKENPEVYRIYQDDRKNGIKRTPRQIRAWLKENE